MKEKPETKKLTTNKNLLMEAKGISKVFPGTVALNKVDFKIYAGNIHAIAGENGAGKSTLIKILGGVHSPTAGGLTYEGKLLRLNNPQDAIRHGIMVIHQELSLAPNLSAEQNIFLGHYPRTKFGTIDQKVLRERTKELLDRLAINIDPTIPVKYLSIAQQQMIEIAKALSVEAKILILDEPTAVLDKENVEKLFELLHRLRNEGIGMVYISHRLNEIFEMADDVMVLRDGEVTGQALVSEIDKDWLVQRMIGRKNAMGKRKKDQQFGDKVLEVESLSRTGEFQDISFYIKAGEIVSLAGLVGAGRSEVARTIFGVNRPNDGTIYISGQEVKIRKPQQAIDLGIAYVPEDRKSQSLFLNRSVKENITIADINDFFQFPALRSGREKEKCLEMIDSLNIKTSHPSIQVRNLSGGNQQKVILSRWLGKQRRILILDEPTRGVDIGAKQEIYSIIEQLAAEGLAILMISSEMEEVIRLSDRVIVLRKGKISAKLSGDAISEEAILQAALISEEDY